MTTTIFYTAIEIAELLKISKSLAYRLIAQGDLQAIRFGRTVRVRKEDLDTFITGCVLANPEYTKIPKHPQQKELAEDHNLQGIIHD